MRAAKVWTILLLGCIPAAAWGQSASGGDTQPIEMNGATVMVLGVSINQPTDASAAQFDSTARTTIQGRVKELYPNSTIATGNLSATDLGCRSVNCWTQLATAHNANYLIVGSYTDTPLKYKVELALISSRGELLKDATNDCRQCEAPQKLTKLTEAVGRLFQPEPVDSAPLPSILPKVDNKLPSCPQYLSFQRGVAAGASSAFLLTGLVAGISLSALDGKHYSPTETYSLGPLQGLAYGASVLPAVGLGLSLGLSRPSAPADSARARTESPVCVVQPQGKRTFGRGFALGALGGLVVTSLIATATFGGLNSYDYDATRKLSLQTPTIASSVVLGAAAVGFIAAWPW